MMTPLHADRLISIAVAHTVDSLVGGVLLAALAWLWLRLARRQNSTLRFIILFILLVGIAVLPVVGLSWISQASAADAHSLVTLPQNAAEYLFLVWALIACVGLARIGVGYLQLRRIKRSCSPVDDDGLDERVRTSLLDSPRAAILCTSDRVNVPTALGLARPARIVIPSWLMVQISADELHHLVLHELAHLRRWDDWSNLAQKVLGALLFFHPAVWWLQRRLSLEREMACDECVLAQTGNAKAYAKSLANMAERSFVRRTVALAQAAVSRLHDTTLRVSKILSPDAGRGSIKVLPLFASVAAVSGLTIAVAVASPDLISFSAPVGPPALAAVHAPSVTLAKSQPRPTLASLPIHRSAVHQRAATKSPHVIESVAKRPAATQQLRMVKVRANADRQIITRPAVLIFWQETYESASGRFIQRSYVRLVVLKQIPKEQPKNI